MKYYIIAGERSGDLHGSNLIRAIRRYDPQAECRAWGGDMMQEAGATLVKHYAAMAFMGFWEVAKNIFKIRGFLRQCQNDILDYQPDVVILIDYAGFNMRVARFAKEQGFRTFYYISPKVWAWNQNRALNIKRYVDKLFVIFPFEKAFFQRFDYEVYYVGNPLFDAIADFQPDPHFLAKHHLAPQKPIIALLPGSRQQEVEQMLSVMVATQAQFEQYQYVIAAVSNLPSALYEPYIAQGCVVVTDAAYDLLSVATAAMVTSGTATLETALFEVPQVVCYRASWLSYQIGKRLIRVPFISLVNLIANREVVKELIQGDLTPHRLEEELQKILPEGVCHQSQREGYRQIKQLLGEQGASDRAGELMVEFMRQTAQ